MKLIVGAVGGALLAGLTAKLLGGSDPRQKVIKIALEQLGEQDPDTYWAEVQPGLVRTGASWCGGFALWVLRQAGLTEWPWIVGKGFLFNLPITRNPLPGDIVYFQKLQHHAILKSIDGTTVMTIDGNQSPGESVRERTRALGDVTAFYSIQPLIDAS
jgi:hypothetical protein